MVCDWDFRLVTSSPFRRGDRTPFCQEEIESAPTPTVPSRPDIVTPGKIDHAELPKYKNPVPGKLDDFVIQENPQDLNVQDIIFKKKIVETPQPTKTKFAPIDLGEQKEASFSLLDLATPSILGEKIIETGVEIVKNKVKQTLNGFRIEKLPSHEEDFATKWFYSSQNELVAENIIIEYNAYLQVLKELKNNKIELPKGFVGETIAFDLETHILDDFRTKNQKYDPSDNLAHRAWFAHCTKRAIDSLRDGEFRGEDGYVKKHPEIADIIERRIDQIILEKTLYKNEI